ncbi:Mannosyl-3-phosphoglycerate synthase [Rhypophila decipiens]
MRVDYFFEPCVKYYGLAIQRVQKVVELGVGTADGLNLTEGNSIHVNLNTRGSARADDPRATFAIPFDASRDIESKMVIIVPTKNEPVDRLISVIGGIPSSVLVILISNSSRTSGDDKYKQEVDALREHCLKAGNRPALAIHQRDPGAGEAFEAVGAPEMTDGDHRIRNGKGEGMLLGVALAAMCPERQYVGFVDSDNIIPGAIDEYVRAYALGFYMHREEPDVMVRIKWGSKPKPVRNRLEPSDGRSSRIVNKWFNRMFSLLPNASSAGNAAGLMQTGNAGEHAMTMSLALKLNWAGGYAIEPYQIMCLLFMAVASAYRPNGVNGVNGLANGRSHRHTHQPGHFSAKVVQIETTNPHIHRATDDEHIRGMILEGLGCMYHRLPSPPSAHSRAANGHNADFETQFRSEMLAFMEQNDLGRTVPPAPRVSKPLESLDLRKMHSIMLQSCRSLEVIGPCRLVPSRSQNGRA